MLVERSLYGMKSSEAVVRSLMAEKLHALG